MNKEELEKYIKDTYGIEFNQVYLDRDKRMSSGNRRLRVVGVCDKEGKATCERYFGEQWKSEGPVTFISFKRLSNKKLFTKLDNLK